MSVKNYAASQSDPAHSTTSKVCPTAFDGACSRVSMHRTVAASVTHSLCMKKGSLISKTVLKGNRVQCHGKKRGQFQCAGEKGHSSAVHLT